MKRIYSKLKYYLKEIKANAKFLYNEEAYEEAYMKEFSNCPTISLVALAPVVCTTIMVITPLTIISFAFNGEPLLYVCCLVWVLVFWWILAILFRN